MSENIGSWMIREFGLTPDQIQHLTRLQRQQDVFLGSLAVQLKLIHPGVFAYGMHRNKPPHLSVHAYLEAWDPSAAEPYLGDPDILLRHGWILLGARGSAAVVGCLEWPHPVEQKYLAWLLERPVQFLVLPRDEWEIRAQERTLLFQRWRDWGLKPAILEPWVLHLDAGESSIWSEILADVIRRKRPYLTLRREGAEAWSDYHTPEIPLKPLDPDAFQSLWTTLTAVLRWHQPAYFPHRTGGLVVKVRKRRLLLLFELRQMRGRRWIHLRLMEPEHLADTLYLRSSALRLLQALDQWQQLEAPGVWLVTGVTNPVFWCAVLALPHAWHIDPPRSWTGVHARLGRWPELDDVLPVETLAQQKETKTPRIFLMAWDWDPERFQNYLLLANRAPVFVVLNTPSGAHALRYLYQNGFDSVLRAGRIRGWMSLLTPRPNCPWCADLYRPASSLEWELGPRRIYLDVSETWRRSQFCEACRDLRPWQAATPQLEWGILTGDIIPQAERLQSFLQALSEATQNPLWMTLIRGLRRGQYHAPWALSFLQDLVLALTAPE